jgi:DNA-binding protein YbaB
MNVFKLIEDNGLTLHGDIEHFAELIRQEEREACAKVCEERQEVFQKYYTKGLAGMCAEAIRARSEL